MSSMLPMWLVLLCPPLLGILYILSDLRRPECAGPFPKEVVWDRIEQRLWWKHAWSAGTMVYLGFALAVRNYQLAVFGLVAGIVLGWLVGWRWSRMRLRHVEIRHSGSVQAVLSDKPSADDAFASPMHEGSVAPLPLKADLIVVAACAIVGALLGLAFSTYLGRFV